MSTECTCDDQDYTTAFNAGNVSCTMTNCGDCCPICRPRYCPCCGRRISPYWPQPYNPWPYQPWNPWVYPTWPPTYVPCDPYPYPYGISGGTWSDDGDYTITIKGDDGATSCSNLHA